MVDDNNKDNPGGGSTDDDPPFLNKVNLDGSSTNDNPGSRDFNIPNQLASLDFRYLSVAFLSYFSDQGSFKQTNR